MSAGDVVIDDHLLLRTLLGDEPNDLRPRGGRVATTGLWYHRLCRALADPSVTGVLSRSLGDVEEHIASATLRSVIDLPDWIELISLRALAWPMADLLAAGAHGNLLCLEALATARELDAQICLAEADTNPQLLRVAEAHEVRVRVIDAAG